MGQWRYSLYIGPLLKLKPRQRFQTYLKWAKAQLLASLSFSFIFPNIISKQQEMDATLEELWKKFTLSEEEKGVLSVHA